MTREQWQATSADVREQLRTAISIVKRVSRAIRHDASTLLEALADTQRRLRAFDDLFDAMPDSEDLEVRAEGYLEWLAEGMDGDREV